MKFVSCVVAALSGGLVAGEFGSAHAAVFSLTPITNTTPNFAGQISILGTVTAAPGEVFYSPTVQSGIAVPFLPSFSAGFNGLPQGWDPGFLAWGGTGTYTGPIYFHTVTPANLGYAGGMPVGLYNANLLGPGGQPGITLFYLGADGQDHALARNYAINVTPAPGALAALGAAGAFLGRRRRS
ncbi:MAG: hypothetical protein IT439_00105 [Phycisphaerales bacterium]|nr:hypothetical protein [Phycisphaerales bacterium]